MASPSIRYRINSHAGTLFVRETICGEVIARIPNDKLELASKWGHFEVVTVASTVSSRRTPTCKPIDPRQPTRPRSSSDANFRQFWTTCVGKRDGRQTRE